jgi:hypothetical protein
VSTGRSPDGDLLLQPTVSWPREMTVGRQHLIEVDLALVTLTGEPAAWPLDEEDYPYTILLDGGGEFDLWAVRDATVVLHRFGGSYGPAEFVVIPREKPGGHSLWLTALNQWGFPVGSHELQVSVRVEGGGPPEGADREVPVGLSPVPGEADGGQGTDPSGEHPAALSPRAEPGTDEQIGRMLAHGDAVTVDVPFPEPDVPVQEPPAQEPPAKYVPAGPTQADAPGVTKQDLGYPDLGYGDAGDLNLADLTPAPGRTSELRPYPEAEEPRRRDGARPAARLAEAYSVAGLRRSPSGRLHWALLPLFPPGSARGEQVTFTARCAPSDEHGTVFAVFAEPEDRADLAPRLESVKSAKIPPGIYRVTAELLHPGPGHVEFRGLPVLPREDLRPWAEIFETVPRGAPGDGPAHLIAAIEISGPDSLVRQRIESVRRLITHVAAEARGFVCYSVITYGPHSVHNNNPEYPEVPVATLAWAETADDALAVLARLSRGYVEPIGYEFAAQLECVLTDLDRNITGQEGRPVIVTVGARPPHPPRVDPGTQIIPCRYRRDWLVPTRRLQARYAGIAFGAIRDHGRADNLWNILGANATTTDEFFAARFADALGLTGTTPRPIPVPMFSS